MVQVVHVVPVRGRGLDGPRVLPKKGAGPLTHLSGLPRISLYFAGIDQVWSVTQFFSICFLPAGHQLRHELRWNQGCRKLKELVPINFGEKLKISFFGKTQLYLFSSFPFKACCSTIFCWSCYNQLIVQIVLTRRCKLRNAFTKYSSESLVGKTYPIVQSYLTTSDKILTAVQPWVEWPILVIFSPLLQSNQ